MWIASGEHRGFFCSVIDVDEVAGRAVVRLRPSEADVAVRTRELVEEWEREAAEAERGRPRSSHREGSREREREHKKSRHREKERDRRRDREPGEERCGSASPCHAALRSATVTWTSIFDHHRVCDSTIIFHLDRDFCGVVYLCRGREGRCSSQFITCSLRQ